VLQDAVEDSSRPRLYGCLNSKAAVAAAGARAAAAVSIHAAVLAYVSPSHRDDAVMANHATASQDLSLSVIQHICSSSVRMARRL
jgi:hypothetical protein